jgi:hypothetical protein
MESSLTTVFVVMQYSEGYGDILSVYSNLESAKNSIKKKFPEYKVAYERLIYGLLTISYIDSSGETKIQIVEKPVFERYD